MKNLRSFLAALVVVVAISGCSGVDNSVEVPDNPDPMPAGIGTPDDGPPPSAPPGQSLPAETP